MPLDPEGLFGLLLRTYNFKPRRLKLTSKRELAKDSKHHQQPITFDALAGRTDLLGHPSSCFSRFPGLLELLGALAELFFSLPKAGQTGAQPPEVHTLWRNVHPAGRADCAQLGGRRSLEDLGSGRGEWLPRASLEGLTILGIYFRCKKMCFFQFVSQANCVFCVSMCFFGGLLWQIQGKKTRRGRGKTMFSGGLFGRKAIEKPQGKAAIVGGSRNVTEDAWLLGQDLSTRVKT